MRRIYITNDFHNEVLDLYKTPLIRNGFTPIDLLNSYKSDILSFSLYARKKKLYLQKIIDDYPYIIAAKPNEIEELKRDFNNILHFSKISQSFFKNIVRCLMYNELRQIILPTLLKLNLKTCAYCNSQLTVIITEKYKRSSVKYGFIKGQIKNHIGRFDLDHINPKSKYPFLASSFYNLIPSCANCNRAKSDSEINFQFFTEDNLNLNVFKFEIDKSSIENYWSSRDHKDLLFEFKNVSGVIDENVLKEYNNRFNIQELYETQRDVIEELIHLYEFYNDDAQKDIVDSYHSLFKDQSMVKRIIIGNYTKEEDIHKRPLSKFTHDIAKQLNLI